MSAINKEQTIFPSSPLFLPQEKRQIAQEVIEQVEVIRGKTLGQGPQVFPAVMYREQLKRSALYDPENQTTYVLWTKCKTENDPLIGRGSVRSCKLASDRTGRLFALTVQRKEKLQSVAENAWIESEKKCLRRLKNIPQIVQTLLTAETDRKLFTLQEYCNGGNLLQAMNEGPISSLPLKNRIGLLLDIARGANQMHQKGVLHRDLSLENIFLKDSEEGLHAKIGDLGYACTEDDGEMKRILVGGCAYSAPEKALVYNSQDRERIAQATTRKADCWSLGCIFYEFMTLRGIPWRERNKQDETLYAETMSNIQRLKEYNHLHSIRRTLNQTDYPARLCELTLNMLALDPQERPSSEEAVEQIQKSLLDLDSSCIIL